MSYDLRIERLIDGTPEEVFDAFTDADAMLEWYGVHQGGVAEVIAWDLTVGGTTSVEFGTTETRYREDMTYQEVERPHRLVYVERFTQPDGRTAETVVTVMLADRDGKTLFTLVHTGFATEAERDGTQSGWPSFIDRMERIVARRRTA